MRVFAIIQFLATMLFFSIIGIKNGYCQHVRIDSLSSYIEFGTGGGFAGSTHGYLLTEQGMLFSTQRVTSNDPTITFIKKLKKSQVAPLFKSAQKIASSYSNFNEPGNMYSYMYYISNYASKQYVWGNPNSAPSKKILKLSSKLAKITTP